MAKFKRGDWIEIEDRALGLRSVGLIVGLVLDINKNLFYSIDWRINECSKTQGIQPTSLYPVNDLDLKGRSCPAGEVLYGSGKKF